MHFRKSNMYFLGLVVCFVAGCVGINKYSSPNGLDFKDVQQFPLGAFSSSLREQFGQPDKILSDVKEKDLENWIYLVPNHKYPRAVFLVEKKSGEVLGKSFHFLDEHISNLKVFLGQLPSTKFKIERRKQTRHYIPNELDYSNEALGIYFTVGDARQNVEQVAWVNPKKNPFVAKY